MRLVVSEWAGQVWGQLEGDSGPEWTLLEACAAQREWTSGPGVEAIARLRALAARLGVPLRVERR